MDLTLLGAIPWYAQFLAVVLIIVSVVLIILVLLQKGRGGGLSAAFGGAGGQSAFGSKTGDVFTWATIVVVGLFLLLCMLLTTKYVPRSEIDETLQTTAIQSPQPAPVAETAEVPAAAPLATDGGEATPTAPPAEAAAPDAAPAEPTTPTPTEE